MERIIRRAAGLDGHIPYDERFRRQPTESKIEEEFQYWMSKFLAVDGRAQVPVSTSRGNYRLDFLFDGRVAVELDGKRFHDGKRDAIRDEAILRETEIEEIIRIPGEVWWWREEDTMHVIETWHRRFFECSFTNPFWVQTSDGFKLSIEFTEIGASWSRYADDADTIHLELGGDDGIHYAESFDSYFNPWRENHSLRRQDCFVARRTKSNIGFWYPHRSGASLNLEKS